MRDETPKEARHRAIIKQLAEQEKNLYEVVVKRDAEIASYREALEQILKELEGADMAREPNLARYTACCTIADICKKLLK